MQVTDKQKIDIVRDMWIAHDARWLLKTALKYGFDAANELNLATQRSMGKTEVKRLFQEFGDVEIKNIDDLLEFYLLSTDIFVAPSLKFTFSIIDENTISAKITNCYVHQMVTLAGTNEVYRCAGADRFSGGLKGMGLEGTATNCVDANSCKGDCEITIRVKW